MRRLGEDLFRGVVPKGSQYIPSEHPVEPKPKLATFFKNSNLHLRLVSTLIIIKTVTQGKFCKYFILYQYFVCLFSME